MKLVSAKVVQRPLKILIITSKFPRFENDPQPPFVFCFAKELVKMGHEVYAVAPHDRGARKEEVLEGVRIFRFRYFFPASLQRLSYGPGIPVNIHKSLLAAFQMPFFILSEILMAKKVAKKFRPDVVHAHWAFPQGLAAKFTGVPYFINFYGGEFFMAKKFKLVWLLKYVVDSSSASFTLTNYYVRLMQQAGLNLSSTPIPLGVDTSNFRPGVSGSADVRKKFCRKNELMVLFVGRLVERKGPDFLLSAFRRVAMAVPNSKLVIVGGGPLNHGLEKQARKLRLSEKVIFAGEIPNAELPKYYCAADVFVLPSIVDRNGDMEGQGVVYAEAMACKTPVIGTKTGGIPDVISHGEVGLLIPLEKEHGWTEKDAGSLADGMIRLLEDSKLRKAMGENAYKLVQKRFSWDRIAAEYVRIFSDGVKK